MQKQSAKVIQKRKLGRSEIEISELGFGCMSLEASHGENEALIHQAVELGFNFFDTADLYDKGWNEETLGKALKPVRKEIVLATKVGNQWRKDGSGWDWNPTKEYILKAVEDSLRRLQTDYIDLYQLHGGTIEDPMDEAIEAFELLRKQGKIREYGISSIRPNVIRKWVSVSNISSVMMQYSLLDRRPEEECLDLLRGNGIGVLARGTLAKGLLAGKPADDYLDKSKEQVNSLQQLMEAGGNMIGQALAFVLDHPAISSAVVGIRTREQLQEVFRAYQQGCTQQQLASLKKHREIAPSFYEKHR